MSKNLAAFVAGFGTSYFRNEQLRKEQERRDKADQRAQEAHDRQMEEYNRKQEDRRKVEEGLTEASNMKVGELDEAKVTRAVNANLGAGLSEEEKAGARTAMLDAIKRDGTNAAWRNDGGVLDQTRVSTTEGDVLKKTAEAYKAGGIDYAGTARVYEKDAGDKIKEELQGFALKAPMHELARLYSHHPDGYELVDSGEMAKPDEKGNKFVVRFQDKDGNNLYRRYADEAAFRQLAANTLTGSPKEAMAAMELYRKTARDNKAEAYADEDQTMQREKHSQDQQLFPLQLETAQNNVIKSGVDAKFAEPRAQLALATDQVQLDTARKANRKADIELDDLTAEATTGIKKLTSAEKKESAEVQAARVRFGNLSKEEQETIMSTPEEKLSPAQAQLKSQLATAWKPDPKHVAVYGADPHLLRRSAGGQPYQHTPTPPAKLQKEGVVYEEPDGTLVTIVGGKKRVVQPK